MTDRDVGVTSAYPHPQAFEDFAVGDTVFCLAWIGMPFRVSVCDPEKQYIALDGLGPCSLPDGAQLDIYVDTIHFITHNQWDQLWYWPDRLGETYLQVYDRFLAAHDHGEVITGYQGIGGSLYIDPQPHQAMTFRLYLDKVETTQTILAEPVVAIPDDGGALIRTFDPSIPADRWVASGPIGTVTLTMKAYRWSLTAGDILLNWDDFPKFDELDSDYSVFDRDPNSWVWPPDQN
jgi:hypothetical protein